MVSGLVQPPSTSVRIFDAFESRGQRKLYSDDLICTISTYISTSISFSMRVASFFTHVELMTQMMPFVLMKKTV